MNTNLTEPGKKDSSVTIRNLMITLYNKRNLYPEVFPLMKAILKHQKKSFKYYNVDL